MSNCPKRSPITIPSHQEACASLPLRAPTVLSSSFVNNISLFTSCVYRRSKRERRKFPLAVGPCPLRSDTPANDIGARDPQTAFSH
ncbi:hypothetical protein CDAR_386491 [Caerostris darwini]|uniref:Uncharacterized protein n=1 Tax=Caerostris darwini TaxID=1538125 RepID=A0AAV4QH07_9ARAC|nr:hypothetical protein CDAR_386491 [Caerostris darwini]